MLTDPAGLLKAEPRQVSERVWVGPYMDPQELLFFLEENNIKIVISLLDEDLVYERRLFVREYRYLTPLGIRVFTVPIKPFMRDDLKVRQLEALLKVTRPARVYVHSYLGRFRVKLVEEILGNVP